MFVIIGLFTIVLVGFLSIRDWILSPRLSLKTVHKSAREAISVSDWERARKELHSLSESGKGDKTTQLLDIQILRGTGEIDEALRQATIASRTHPEELLFRLEEGKILLELGRAKEALAAFKVCAPIIRGESDILALGSALLRAGDPVACLELIEPWTAASGEFAALTGDAYFEQKQFQKTIVSYYQALEMGWKRHEVFTQLGHAYRRLGNLAEAEKIFRKLMEKDPSDRIATLGLGACMQERRQFRKALLIYQAGKGWSEAGICALYLKKYLIAEKYFLKGLEEESPTPQLLAYYGYSLECQKKWTDAEQVYLRHIQRFPDNPQGFRALAWLFGVGISTILSQEEGVNFAYVAVKLKSDPVSWEILSACEARIGNFAKAYQILQSLIAHDHNQESRTRRQQALRRLRKNLPLGDNLVVRSLVA